MLLETLDVRKNDILIFSENKFDFEKNFKVIFKNHKIKKPYQVSYFEVCDFLKEPSPKNIIVYRLMTNVDDLDAYSTNYGYFIRINGEMELIYFDPVFAIKDLRHLRFSLNPNQFRFKIQQVGLTSLKESNYETDFREVYSFDLKAVESQNQNDKIFADIIFAFDEGYDDEVEEVETFKTPMNFTSEENSSMKLSNIKEAEHHPSQNISKANIRDEEKYVSHRNNNIYQLKNALGIPEDAHKKSFSELLREQKQMTGEKTGDKDKKEGDLLNLFQSASHKPTPGEREKDSYVLKFSREYVLE